MGWSQFGVTRNPIKGIYCTEFSNLQELRKGRILLYFFNDQTT